MHTLETNEDYCLLLRAALTRDLPLSQVLASIEKKILENAAERHNCVHKRVYEALRIPKSSYYDKRRCLFKDAQAAEPAQ